MEIRKLGWWWKPQHIDPSANIIPEIEIFRILKLSSGVYGMVKTSRKPSSRDTGGVSSDQVLPLNLIIWFAPGF
jgi:hypothetical protein